jgi:hypothetical protein
MQLRATDGIAADQIDRIDIDMPEAAYGHGGWQAERPLAPIGAQMNWPVYGPGLACREPANPPGVL